MEQSNVIILGKVTDRRAVLTDDKLGIYSEFSINVSEIFKDDLNLFFIGQVSTASRPSGAVRFPSGRIQQYTVSRQGYPQQDKVDDRIGFAPCVRQVERAADRAETDRGNDDRRRHRPAPSAAQATRRARDR